VCVNDLLEVLECDEEVPFDTEGDGYTVVYKGAASELESGEGLLSGLTAGVEELLGPWLAPPDTPNEDAPHANVGISGVFAFELLEGESTAPHGSIPKVVPGHPHFWAHLARQSDVFFKRRAHAGPARVGDRRESSERESRKTEHLYIWKRKNGYAIAKAINEGMWVLKEDLG